MIKSNLKINNMFEQNKIFIKDLVNFNEPTVFEFPAIVVEIGELTNHDKGPLKLGYFLKIKVIDQSNTVIDVRLYDGIAENFHHPVKCNQEFLPLMIFSYCQKLKEPTQGFMPIVFFPKWLQQ